MPITLWSSLLILCSISSRIANNKGWIEPIMINLTRSCSMSNNAAYSIHSSIYSLLLSLIIGLMLLKLCMLINNYSYNNLSNKGVRIALRSKVDSSLIINIFNIHCFWLSTSLLILLGNHYQLLKLKSTRNWLNHDYWMHFFNLCCSNVLVACNL